jgi:hypothetical protein
MSDMPGKLIVRLSIYRKRFLPRLPQDAYCFFFFIPKFKFTFKPESLMVLKDIAGIDSRKIAFSKTEIVNPVEQVRLSNPVSAGNSYDPFGE